MTLAMGWDEWARHDATALAALVRRGLPPFIEMLQAVSQRSGAIEPALGRDLGGQADVVSQDRIGNMMLPSRSQRRREVADRKLIENEAKRINVAFDGGHGIAGQLGCAIGQRSRARFVLTKVALE